METGAPMRLTRGFLACLLVLLCSFGLCGCDFGDLFKTTKDKNAAQTEQTASSEGESAAEGEAAEGEGADSAASSAAGTSSGAAAASSAAGPSSGEAGGASESEPASEPEPAMLSIHVLVDATHANRGYFADTTVSLPEGSTVYDALVALGLPFGGNSEYVRSINGLAEFAEGPGSGWMFSVNGNVPMTPCGGYVLNDGDNVRWYYVTNADDM